MTRIIEKRLSLYKQLTSEQKQNTALKSQISRLQALATLGTATSMIAHEINNLLTPLGGHAALALKHPKDEALVEKVLEKTVRNSQRASKIMDSILTLANGQTQQKKEMRLASLVDEVFTCLCRDFAKDKIIVNIQIAEDLEVWAVPVQIQQVLMNLVLNARAAMLPGGGVLTIQAGDTTEKTEIEVTDTGCGIEPGHLENIFEPFFTTCGDKQASSERSGAGLGLAFCKQIIDAHDGGVSVESKPAKGTTFRIVLPKHPSGTN